MAMLDAFNTDTFGTISLTQAINELPWQPRRLRELGIFAQRGIPTTGFLVESKAGVLSILPTRARGSDPSLGKAPKRTTRPFETFHIPHDDVILPGDIQGIRQFGSEDVLQGMTTVVNERLAQMKNNHEITHEHMRAGAIQGIVKDADGVTTLVDLFSEFGVTQQTTDFIFGTDATPIREKCLDVKRQIKDALGGTLFTGVMGLCHSEFFNELISHPTVTTAYERFRDGELLRTDPRDGFDFAGIRFEEYDGTVEGIDFIPHRTCRFFPMGVAGLFEHVSAPADFNEAVNTIGLPVYAKQEPRKMNRGIDIHTQSNPFFMCTRPKVLVKGFSST